jgi:hypothetical protein
VSVEFSQLEAARWYRSTVRVLSSEIDLRVFDHAEAIGPTYPGPVLGPQERRSGRLLGPDLITEARGWIDDCGWTSDHFTDDRVEWVVARHYCGGIAEFIRNTNGG